MPQTPSSDESPGDHLVDAKDRLMYAAEQFDPIRSLRSHPYATLGVAAAVGFAIGANKHPAAMKAAKSGFRIANSLRPVLLTAGKLVGSYVASHYAAKAGEAAATESSDDIDTETAQASA